MERATRFELATSTLGRWHSTTELRPLLCSVAGAQDTKEGVERSSCRWPGELRMNPVPGSNLVWAAGIQGPVQGSVLVLDPEESIRRGIDSQGRHVRMIPARSEEIPDRRHDKTLRTDW